MRVKSPGIGIREGDVLPARQRSLEEVFREQEVAESGRHPGPEVAAQQFGGVPTGEESGLPGAALRAARDPQRRIDRADRRDVIPHPVPDFLQDRTRSRHCLPQGGKLCGGKRIPYGIIRSQANAIQEDKENPARGAGARDRQTS
jgi:hypothetical protein